ncbi:ATP-binding protein [Sphaerisporangium sp. NPDC051011]|uniref:ATP-binding protein n=1 Tax=Sphaerisporangium sp. NPDC051011 TaxID=3155792 RepID=UPI0033CE815C
MKTLTVEWERTVHWELPCHPVSIGKARALARDTLTESGLESLVEQVELIVSELATNAIRYDLSITLTLRVAGRRIRGEVLDQGPAFVPPQRKPVDDDEHGRGLLLVKAMADDWGVEAAEDSAGKIVWFTCTAAEDPVATAQQGGSCRCGMLDAPKVDWRPSTKIRGAFAGYVQRAKVAGLIPRRRDVHGAVLHYWEGQIFLAFEDGYRTTTGVHRDKVERWCVEQVRQWFALLEQD